MDQRPVAREHVGHGHCPTPECPGARDPDCPACDDLVRREPSRGRTRPGWDEYFLDVARVVARRSTCPRVRDGVGCVLVCDRQVLATGYAGSVRGLPHCVDVGCELEGGRCVRTVHAEVNAVLQAARHGVSVGGATAYCTLSPCWGCFKALANGGAARVVFAVRYDDVRRQEAAARALGVGWEHLGDEVYRRPATPATASTSASALDVESSHAPSLSGTSSSRPVVRSTVRGSLDALAALDAERDGREAELGRRVAELKAANARLSDLLREATALSGRHTLAVGLLIAHLRSQGLSVEQIDDVTYRLLNLRQAVASEAHAVLGAARPGQKDASGGLDDEDGS